MFERVIGPFRGYHVAAYSSVAVGGQYAGYFKVFARPVASYFDEVACVVKGTCCTLYDDPGQALALALKEGWVQIETCPATAPSDCEIGRRIFGS